MTNLQISLLSLILLLLMGLAEWLHARKIRRIAALAFGPKQTGRPWSLLLGWGRSFGIAMLTWGLLTLYLLPAGQTEEKNPTPEGGYRHILLLVDVSPSMRLEDSGEDGKQRRILRAKDVVDSVFQRINLEQAKVSVVAVYTEAKPIVSDTSDLGVVRNILDDLPLRWAFPTGKTNLMAGIRECVAMAKPWQPDSTTLVIVSDGDSVPDTGMPPLPRSIQNTLVLGLGNPVQGKFIDGHQSRQDASTLRQVAARLKGTYVDVNVKNVPSDAIFSLTNVLPLRQGDRYALRELALAAIVVGSLLLALLPILLAKRIG